MKAWNHGAAIMTKANTEGIDFVIPIVLPKGKNDPQTLLNLGPLYGLWSLEQEEAASKVIAYIVIDSKNIQSMSENDVDKAAKKCKPTKANFLFHQPINPYITLVPCLSSQAGRDHVKIFRSPAPELLDKRPLQLKIGAFGISHNTYKCLENRPNTERLLNQLLHMDRNPLRGLNGENNVEIKSGILDCLPLQCDPRREFNMSVLEN